MEANRPFAMDIRGVPHHGRQTDVEPGAARDGLPQALSTYSSFSSSGCLPLWNAATAAFVIPAFRPSGAGLASDSASARTQAIRPSEVDRGAVGRSCLGRPDDGHQRSSGSNQACGPLPDVAPDAIEHPIDSPRVFLGPVVEVYELLAAEAGHRLTVGRPSGAEDRGAEH